VAPNCTHTNTCAHTVPAATKDIAPFLDRAQSAPLDLLGQLPGLYLAPGASILEDGRAGHLLPISSAQAKGLGPVERMGLQLGHLGGGECERPSERHTRLPCLETASSELGVSPDRAGPGGLDPGQIVAFGAGVGVMVGSISSSSPLAAGNIE
jgi:hypothetical protein